VIVGAHDTGPLIRSKDGFWLAIPTPAAGKSLRGGRITPGEWERRRGLRLRFVYRRTGPSLLVAEGRLNTKGQAVVSRSKTGRRKVTAPIFLLVPQVKMPKRLDLARDAERAHEAVPGLIVANWTEGQHLKSFEFPNCPTPFTCFTEPQNSILAMAVAQLPGVSSPIRNEQRDTRDLCLWSA
jgi:hypothetical protein